MPPHSWTDRFRSRFGLTEGQTMAEYAVVLGVITIALIGAFSFVGGSVSTALSQIATRI
jgi:Flp pilus assembly pilin Flp